MSRSEWTRETINERYVIYQGKTGYRYNLDSLLLAGFARLKPGLRVLDVGTGMGILPVLLCSKEPRLVITAVEILEDQAELAQTNMDVNALDQVTILRNDIRRLANSHHNRYDLVISNPPYYVTGCGQHSPDSIRSQSRHEGSLCLEELMTKAWKLVAPRGRFVCIYPADRVADVLRETAFTGFRPLRIRFVHPKANQPSRVFLLEAGKDAGRHLQVEKPLVMHDENGGYTEEIERVMAGGSLD